MRCDPDELNTRPRPAGMACQVCGCTDDKACPGGCYWVLDNPPLCSACVTEEDLAASEETFAMGDGFAYGTERCPASSTPAAHVLIWINDTSGYCARCRAGFVT
jgi:hypothetical protein